MSNLNLGTPTVTVAETMGRLGLSRATVIRYLRKGYLQGFQSNPGQPYSWWRVYEHSIEEFMMRREGAR